MTVSTTTNKVDYIGNGVATSFAIPFPFLEQEHLKVYQLLNDVQTERTDWTVSGGNMIFTTAPQDGAKIVIMRKVPLTQETDYRENEVLPAETLEKNFDKLTLITQQLAEESDRAVKIGMFSDTDPSTLVNDIEILYGIRDKISTVVQNKTDINTIAANISNVNTAATNIAAIQAAPTAASNAATSATNAQTWAEGNDTAVTALGGTHSAKKWAQQAAVSAAGTKFKLFQHQWFDYQPDDLAWLRADTFSWQDGTVYSNAYDHLVDDIDGVTAGTETVGGYTVTFYRATDGHKIVLADQETTVSNIYTATGVAWYYVLDTVNNRFKLPRTKYGFDGLRGNVGDYISESLPNITGSYLQSNSNAAGGVVGGGEVSGALYKEGTGGYWNGNTTGVATAPVLKFDASRSSSTYQNGAAVQERGTQMYLYFYVGQYTQSATEQTAGLNAELFNNKADINAANFSSEGKLYLTSLPSPDVSNAVTYTTGASGATYTATDTGWLVVSGYYNGNMASTPQWITIQLENGPRFCIPSANGINGVGPCCYVEKGQSFAVEWANINTSYPITIKLYKAKGAV